MWHSYFQQLQTYLRWQQQKIEALERSIRHLQQQYTELKQQPKTTIEKIEYHFDQLKIETLEGTLNIGLTPKAVAGETIEDVAIPQKTVVPQPTPPIFRAIQEAIYTYVQEEGHTFIERSHGALDDTYKQFIIDDIMRQIDDRIHFYLQQHGHNYKDERQLQEDVIAWMKRDIEHSITSFLKHFPREETNE